MINRINAIKKSIYYLEETMKKLLYNVAYLVDMIL